MQLETKLQFYAKYMTLYLQYQTQKSLLNSDAVKQLDILFEKVFEDLK